MAGACAQWEGLEPGQGLSFRFWLYSARILTVSHWCRTLAAPSGPVPNLISSSPSPLLCPFLQLYLQARAPPEGDSDLATWLLTEPDVQKVPPWG